MATTNTIQHGMQFTMRRSHLFILAGVLWAAVGAMLCWRAVTMTNALAWEMRSILLTVSIVATLIAYRYGFSVVVRRNIQRLRSLNEKASIVAVVSPAGYAMIIAMVTLGSLLRSLEIPGHYLSVPFAVMGGVLLMGSRRLVGGMEGG